MWVESRNQHQVSLLVTFHLIFEAWSLIGTEAYQLARGVRWQVQEFFLSQLHPHGAEITDQHPYTQIMDATDVNSGPHAHVESTL